MNYYERYCGDYARDTSHLALAEHGAYAVLLDVQYSTERGLPAPLSELWRICRAMSGAERRAVDSVATQYFPLGPDGLRWNRRAARDIQKAAQRIAAARANGGRGGRPSKPTNNPLGFINGTQHEPNDNPPETHAGEALPDPMHHTPDPKGQNQEGQERRSTLPAATPPDEQKSVGKTNGHSRASRLPADWQLPDPWRDWAVTVHRLDPQRAVRLSLDFRDYWVAKSGAAAAKLDWQATWRRWVRRSVGDA